MKCPFCDELEDKVVDSRMAKEGEVIRRRRECLACRRRYTTYERVEEILPMVVKKDGRRESFDRTKILAGLKKACEKRPISTATIEAVTKSKFTLRPMSWWMIKTIGQLLAMGRELSELEYLWHVPHRIAGDKLKQAIGEIPHTPPSEAIAASLRAIGYKA